MGKVIDKDFGYNVWLEQMRQLSKKPFTNIGILGEGEADEGGTTVLQYASANEFGATGAGRGGNTDIPERSYIRSTVDEKKRRYLMRGANFQSAIFMGKMTVSRALGLMGMLIKGDIVQKIVDLRSPVNADSTIKAKGSSNPLVDSGRMRQSIDFEVKGNG